MSISDLVTCPRCNKISKSTCRCVTYLVQVPEWDDGPQEVFAEYPDSAVIRYVEQVDTEFNVLDKPVICIATGPDGIPKRFLVQAEAVVDYYADELDDEEE